MAAEPRPVLRGPDQISRPTADEPRARHLLSRLWPFVRPYRGRLAVAMTALLVGGCVGLVYPWYFGELLGDAFAYRDITSLNRNTLTLLLVFGVSAVMVFVRQYLMGWVGERVVADLRRDVHRHLLTLTQRYYGEHPTGELFSRQSDDATRLQKVIGEDLTTALSNLLTLVGGLTMLFVVSPTLTGMVFVVVLPLAVIERVWSRLIRDLARQAHDQLAKAAARMQESLAGVDTVQAFTREGFETERYGEAIERAFGLLAKQVRARSSMLSASTFLVFAAVAAIFWFGGHRVADGLLEPSELGKFFLYTLIVAGAVGSLSDVVGSYNQALGITERLFEILDSEPELRDVEDAVELDTPRGELRFEGVCFGYGEREQVIRDFDLRINPGQICALVGASGSGKTTVGRLLMRLWDPQQGRITFDGHDLRELKLSSLRGAMAEVSQTPWLFSGTIRENIRYGRLDASDEELVAAAEAANVDTFVREFPAGYDTILGERGANLSGGQRQRLAIARALLRDPKVLILDEATSALDSESEHLVQTALERLQHGRSTLVIAHRLSTIRNADQIIVLDHGRVVESGRHEQLIARGDVYARLVARQAGHAPERKRDLQVEPAIFPRSTMI